VRAAHVSGKTEPKTVFESWEARVFEPGHMKVFQQAGEVLEQQPLHGGVIMVVDGPLRKTVMQKQMGKRMRRVQVLSLYNIGFPEGSMRADHVLPPNTLPGTRLNGLYNFRVKDEGRLSECVVIPDQFEVTKTTLDGVSSSTKSARTAFSKKVLTAYHKAMGKATPEQPQKDGRVNGLVAQIGRWVESVQEAIDDHDNAKASVHIRFVGVPYRVPDSAADVRPHNTRLMVPFSKAHATLGAYYVRERGARFGDGSAYCRSVGPKDDTHRTGYLAVNVDKHGAVVPGSHVSHVRKEEHDFMCRKVV
jgi:hypothetical protein